MKKSVVFFLAGLLFLGVCLSSSLIAGEGDATESSSNFSTSGAGEALQHAAEAAAARQNEENAQAASEAMASGMAGLEPKVPVTIQLHVPVSVSNLPPEITSIGVRCMVRLSRASAWRSVLGQARNGGRTVLVSVPVSVPFSDVTRNTIHGSYECRLLIRAGNDEPVSLGHIRSTIELDASQQIVTVRGSF